MGNEENIKCSKPKRFKKLIQNKKETKFLINKWYETMSSHFEVFSDSDKRIPYSLKIKGYTAYSKTNGTKNNLCHVEKM